MGEPQLFRITGMDCADCATMIERGVARLDGVRACSLSFTAAMLKVEGDVTRDAVFKRVRELGYGVAALEPGVEAPVIAQRRWLDGLPSTGVLGFLKFLMARTNTALTVLGALLILPSLLILEIGPLFSGVRLELPLLDALSIAAMLSAGLPIARSAWRALSIAREININVLMTIAAIGAVAIGAYTEAGLVMVLFAIGEALEGYTTERARDAIRGLMSLAPEQATVLRACIDCQGHMGRDGYRGGPCPFCGVEEVVVPVAAVAVGETVLVKPGERIGLDGVIAKGASSVNQAPITGESVPIDKLPGERVFAGSINGPGALEIRVSSGVSDSMLSRIIRMVEQAQERKAPTERFVDAFAKIYTPTVVAIAVMVAILPSALFGAPFWGQQGWLYRALELLVIACPCALVISTPVSVISALGNAARNGVLIKGGAHLEALAGIRAFAFDKTGTLTEGRPSVVRVRSAACAQPAAGHCECAQCDELLALASALERRSEHPLAKAVVDAARHKHLDGRYPAAVDAVAIVGKGVTGTVGARSVMIGSHRHFDSAVPHDQAICDEIDHAVTAGQTAMLISADSAYLGYIVVADRVRTDSAAAIAELSAAGVRATVMLTGDNAATARAIADQAGVSDVRADLLPEHKVDAVNALMREHGAVALVGDGINDAPGLATATLGIAMGAGTAQALETADIALLSNDLRKLPFALHLGRAAVRTIRMNIAFAITIKLVFLLLVLLGYGTMWMAVLADVGASLAVTLFGMRLLHIRPKSA